ncbi:MAG: hypothetical protein QOD06_2199 [Candidatus Binatota bacterium]|nr:hypothetical protein [Candidatus Binatota bacterium]
MIVECPRCNARYRVEEDVVREEPTFKCSRCGNLFAFELLESPPGSRTTAPMARTETARGTERIVPERESADAGATIGRRSDNGETLPFPFGAPAAPPPAETSPAPSTTEPPTPAAELSLDLDRREDGESERQIDDDVDLELPDGDDDDDRFELGSEDLEAHDLESDDEEPLEPDVVEPRFVRDDSRFALGDPAASGSPVRGYLVFVALLLLCYGNLALYLKNHPNWTAEAVAAVPAIGGFLGGNRMLQSRVDLQNLEGTYQSIKDGRNVFIVSGRAVNNSDHAVRSVEIESVLYDARGEPVATKAIFCGNIMSLKIVKDLSSQEISLLQKLQPPVRFEIPAGENAGFSVVFLSPPPKLQSFSARVASAQPVAS